MVTSLAAYYEHRRRELPRRRADLEQKLQMYEREQKALLAKDASTFKGGRGKYRKTVAICTGRVERTRKELGEVVDEMEGRLVPQRVTGGFNGTKIVLVKPEEIGQRS